MEPFGFTIMNKFTNLLKYVFSNLCKVFFKLVSLLNKELKFVLDAVIYTIVFVPKFIKALSKRVVCTLQPPL